MPKRKIKIWRVLAYSALGIVLFLAFTPSTLALDPTEAGQYNPLEEAVVKKIPVMLTAYTPKFPQNDCSVINGQDWSWGIDNLPGDGDYYFYKATGSQVLPYIMEWKKDWKIYQRIFAEPISNDVIAWDKIDKQGVRIPGFLGGKIIEIHDHFPASTATNRNFLGLSVSCYELGNQIKTINSLPQTLAGSYRNDEGFVVVQAEVIDLDKYRQLKKVVALGTCGNLQDPNAANQQKVYNYLAAKNSPLADYASAFIEAGKRYNVNPWFLVSITNQESGLLRNPNTRPAKNNNPGNVKSPSARLDREGLSYVGYDDLNHVIFSDLRMGIFGMAEVIRNIYFDYDLTTFIKIAPKYVDMTKADNDDWIEGVTQTMQAVCLI